MTGNTTDAFSRVDQAHVVLMQAAVALLDSTLSFSGATSEIPLTVRLQNPSGNVTLSVQLLAGGRALFQGSGAASLQRGVSTTIDVTLSPIVTLVAPDSVLLTALGDTARLGGAVVFATGDTLTGSQVTWSGGGGAASVSSSGLAIALAEGVTQATATYQALTRTTRVRVAATVSRVALSADTFSLVVGNSRSLTAAAYDRRNNLLTRTFTWASSNASVATVDNNGLVTGVGAGTATITASTQGVSRGATVTVRLVPVASVAISPASANVLPGGTFQLTATTYDAAGNVLNGRAIAWASSNTSVATVSGTGLVTGVAVGSATITATSEGVTGSASITVGQPVIGVNPTSLGFGAIVGGGAGSQTVAISNTGTGVLTGLSATVSDPAGATPGWVTQLSLNSTTAPATLTVGVDPTGLSTGTYSATITVASSVAGVAAVTIPVTLNVQQLQPIVAARPSSVTMRMVFDSTLGYSARDNSVTVYNAGTGTLNGLSATVTYVPTQFCPLQNWLSAAPSSSTAPTSLSLIARGYLSVGAPSSCSATVTITSTVPGAGQATVSVTYVP